MFRFETAPNASYDRSIEELQQVNTEELIAEMRHKILERSAVGIRNVGRLFQAMDKNGNCSLDVDDFRWGFIDFGCNISKEEAQHLLEAFDKDGNGQVSFEEFLTVVKVSLYL